MNKKILQIQTNFLQEEEAHSPIVTTSKINYEEKLQAASLLQKILSISLAKNFIECWATLKQYDSVQQDGQKHVRTTKTNNMNPKHNINPIFSKQTEQRVRYFQKNQENIHKPRSQSYANRLHRLHTQQLSQQERQPKRNKSVRMINQQIEHSRASILQEIVDKLKNIKKVNEIQQSNSNQANQQILKKITHLERMIRNIKNEERYQNSPPHYRSPFLNQKQDRIRQTNNRRNIQIQSNSVDNSEEDEQLMKTFLTQIEHIRKQIKEIKLNNEAILRSELQRSRASSVSARYHHRPKENNYYIPVQMMPPYMSFNPNYNPNMNPNMNIPQNVNPHQNQMQQTFSQSNFKSEQKNRPQTNSHTQTLSQVPTQTQFQIPKTNKNNSMELKKTISEGVQTQSVQKNTIYTETDDTKFRSSNNYSSQTDAIKSRRPVSNKQIDYRVPYLTQQKYQTKYQKSNNKPFSNLYKDQQVLQPKLKSPYLNLNLDSSGNGNSNSYKQQQRDIFNYKTKQKYDPSSSYNPPSSSNFNNNSESNYNIPVGQISKLMKKIQGISSFIENQSKNKYEKPVSEQINPVPRLNSSANTDNKYQSTTYPTSFRPGQPYQSNPKPNKQPEQVYKVLPAPQFHSQVYSQTSQPISYPKPQTHPVHLSIPQQPYPVRPVNNFNRNDQIKSNGTFYSKNNVYSEIDSSYSLGFPKQVNHFPNPSIQIIKNQSSNIRPHVNFTNYCSVCGRNCGCPRNSTNVFRN